MDIKSVIQGLTLEEKAGLCSGRDFWHTKAVERLGINSVMMSDGPHGLRKQTGEGDALGITESIKAVCFPTASALASSFDRDLLRLLGETLGDECQAENLAVLLGPGLNIKRSPLCGRNFEYFSEDPYLAGAIASAYIQGLQSKGVASCVKHFACNNQETCRMTSSSEVDERTMHEIYLPAFEAAVKEGKTKSVMCSYNRINGVFAAENRELLTGILRTRWGYEGFVVTDWGGVKDRVKGVAAGLDLEMPGGTGPGTQDKRIIAAVRDGSLDEALLDKAVANMIAFTGWHEQNRRPGVVFDREKDHAVAAQAAKECAVLLKNEGGILPLAKNVKAAFIGDFAKTPRYQGSGSSYVNASRVSNAFECAAALAVSYAQGCRANQPEPDAALEGEAVQAAKSADVAVIFAGLPDNFETEGVDRTTMFLPENQNRLIQAVAEVQPNTVVVLHGGSPFEMPWVDRVPAILNMHLAGEGAGEAAAALLSGDANPSGKLAETWPLKLADNPSYLNFPGEKGFVEYREGIYAGYRYYDKKK
jgi:beta-glucosidase